MDTDPCTECGYPSRDRHDCPGGTDMSAQPIHDARDEQGRFAGSPVRVLPARPNPVNNYLVDVQQQLARLHGLAFRIAVAATEKELMDAIEAYTIASYELEARYCDLRDAALVAKGLPKGQPEIEGL